MLLCVDVVNAGTRSSSIEGANSQTQPSNADHLTTMSGHSVSSKILTRDIEDILATQN